MAAQPRTYNISLSPLETAALAVLLPLLAYIAYALHALVAAQRIQAASQTTAIDTLLRELRDTATAIRDSTTAVRDTVRASSIDKDVGRVTRAVEKVVGVMEGWERRWRDDNNNNTNSVKNGGGSTSNGVPPWSDQQHNGHFRRSSAGSRSTHQQEEDADLYRRKVEAMEGLRRLMEAQPAPMVEDADLYRRRVEALEGLRRVLEMQPGVEVLRVAPGAKKKVPGKGAVGGGGGMNFGAALSVRSEGRALKKERSGETLGESLLDL
ncbi:hypothetical protein BFW01_g3037 [Lasiodiplodia theobromae]|uniref:Uncharacterized protein n=1 Tax=Lasiodiplodia theobromae TaxID=45133 RepID=A0A5N5DRG4_9PEZI|nr:uncharacterized protein LTHEOB_4073 [Lasiodiplodia theobromae]KAB2580220.1 hypothetical protein DBV05_g1174 [Lasiodiplodia theobromae]KAF4546765.1 hypothetical protein LTHEOB_4073 [Lasiodiplodia theobromae]KAF9632175.1 hypothetical protein BFW01_g3037 [Lasiodiplodia theobromae]